MTLEDLEQHNKGFIDFRFCDFGLWLLLQEWIVPISLELNQNNLHMKFSVLNVDFNSPSLQPLFKETCARGYSTGYTRWTIFLLNLSRIFLFFFYSFCSNFFAVCPIFSPRFARIWGRGSCPRTPGSYAYVCKRASHQSHCYIDFFLRKHVKWTKKMHSIDVSQWCKL